MSLFLHFFRPTIDAFFASSLPFSYRWRLLALQPIALLGYVLRFTPWIFSSAYEVIWIPTRHPNAPLRAIVFQPRSKKPLPPGRLRPLHLDIHGGAFLGGIPEYDAPLCQLLCQETGAVVVSTQYRYAPRYQFPAAHEDVEDVSIWLVQNAERLWGANPKLLTTSGFSAGGNLAFAVSQMGHGQFKWPSETSVKACLTGYPVLDLRLSPGQKPIPPSFPQKDPLSFLSPLFDAYSGPSRPHSISSPILNPIIADPDDLPPRILLIVAAMDILLDENLKFARRLNEEFGSESRIDLPKRSVQIEVFEKCIHGWLELPSAAIDESTRTKAFNMAIGFLKDVHREHGWVP